MNRFERIEGETETDYAAKLGREVLVATTSGEAIPPEVANYIEATAEPFDERLVKARGAFQRGEDASAAFLLHEPDTII